LHISNIIDALLHKYTMRSKAHKTLSSDFIESWLLNQSVHQLQSFKVKNKESQRNAAGDGGLNEGQNEEGQQQKCEFEENKLHFDTFFEMCLFNNEAFVTKSQLSQQD